MDKWHGPITEKESRDRERYRDWGNEGGIKSADLDLFAGLIGLRNGLIGNGIKGVGIPKLPKGINEALGVAEGLFGDKVAQPLLDSMDPENPMMKAFLPYLAKKNPALAAKYEKVFGWHPEKPTKLVRYQQDPEPRMTNLGDRGGIHARRGDEKSAEGFYYKKNPRESLYGGKTKVIESKQFENPYFWINGYPTQSQQFMLEKIHKGTMPPADDWGEVNIGPLENQLSRTQYRKLDRPDNEMSLNREHAQSEALVRNKLLSDGYDSVFNVLRKANGFSDFGKVRLDPTQRGIGDVFALTPRRERLGASEFRGGENSPGYLNYPVRIKRPIDKKAKEKAAKFQEFIKMVGSL